MKKLTLKESQAPYNIALEDDLLTDEIVILEKNGQPVAAVVPIAEYTAFQAWRDEEKRRQAHQAEEAAIDREHDAFQQMLPELLKQYEGRVVALHNGKVVGVGDDEVEVWEHARQQLGAVPIYVQTVEHPARVYDMPSVEIVSYVDI